MLAAHLLLVLGGYFVGVENLCRNGSVLVRSSLLSKCLIDVKQLVRVIIMKSYLALLSIPFKSSQIVQPA